MWNCIKGCVKEALPRAGWIAVIGIVAGIVALAAGVVATGGAAAVPIALGLNSVLAVAGVTLAGDAIGTLVGCIVGCLFT